MLIPISRSISRAADPREEARKFKEAINAARDARNMGKVKTTVDSLSEEQQAIADRMLEMGCIQFGEFTLKSGQVSPIYIDLRRLISDPGFLHQIALVYRDLLDELEFDYLAALPYAGLPIGSVISLVGGWPLIYSRKEEKTYGTKAQVEGVFTAGNTAVIIDDLITTGGSKLEGIQRLLENDLQVRDVVVLIDRSPDGGQELMDHGYHLHSFLTISALLNYYQESGQIDKDLVSEINRFLGIG
jgi:uridine monophosphate synthetase